MLTKIGARINHFRKKLTKKSNTLALGAADMKISHSDNNKTLFMDKDEEENRVNEEIFGLFADGQSRRN